MDTLSGIIAKCFSATEWTDDLYDKLGLDADGALSAHAILSDEDFDKMLAQYAQLFDVVMACMTLPVWCRPVLPARLGNEGFVGIRSRSH